MGVSEEEECVVSETLSDPTKPAHEIIEVLEDGDAIRNDGVRLTGANKNPWYVLATIYGEQDDSGSNRIEEQNRHIWNSWSYGELRGDQLADINNVFRKRLDDKTVEIPVWTAQINFSNTYFPKGLNCSEFRFKNAANFHHSVFGGIVSFCSAEFLGAARFQNAAFLGKQILTVRHLGSFQLGVPFLVQRHSAKGRIFTQQCSIKKLLLIWRA